MRGGPRPHSGRPKGARNRRTAAAIDALALPTPATPLAYMLRIMNDPAAEEARRDKMALAAAPYLHAKLTPVGWLPGPDDDDDRSTALMVGRLMNGGALSALEEKD